MYYTAFVSYSLLYILWCMSVVSVCVYNRLTSINLRLVIYYAMTRQGY